MSNERMKTVSDKPKIHPRNMTKRELRDNCFVSVVLKGEMRERFRLEAINYLSGTAGLDYDAVRYGTYLYAEVNRLRKKLGLSIPKSNGWRVRKTTPAQRNKEPNP